jgi:hypothetical protein
MPSERAAAAGPSPRDRDRVLVAASVQTTIEPGPAGRGGKVAVQHGLEIEHHRGQPRALRDLQGKLRAP